MKAYWIVIKAATWERWYRDEAASEEALELFAKAEVPLMKSMEWADLAPYGNRSIERVLQVNL